MAKKKVFFCAVWIGDEAGFDMALAPLLDVPGAQVVLKSRANTRMSMPGC